MGTTQNALWAPPNFTSAGGTIQPQPTRSLARAYPSQRIRYRPQASITDIAETKAPTNTVRITHCPPHGYAQWLRHRRPSQKRLYHQARHKLHMTRIGPSPITSGARDQTSTAPPWPTQLAHNNKEHYLTLVYQPNCHCLWPRLTHTGVGVEDTTINWTDDWDKAPTSSAKPPWQACNPDTPKMKRRPPQVLSGLVPPLFYQTHPPSWARSDTGIKKTCQTLAVALRANPCRALHRSLMQTMPPSH